MPSKLIDHALTKTVLRNNTLKMSVNIIQTIQIKYDMSTILDVLEKWLCYNITVLYFVYIIHVVF